MKPVPYANFSIEVPVDTHSFSGSSDSPNAIVIQSSGDKRYESNGVATLQMSFAASFPDMKTSNSNSNVGKRLLCILSSKTGQRFVTFN